MLDSAFHPASVSGRDAISYRAPTGGQLDAPRLHPRPWRHQHIRAPTAGTATEPATSGVDWVRCIIKAWRRQAWSFPDGRDLADPPAERCRMLATPQAWVIFGILKVRSLQFKAHSVEALSDGSGLRHNRGANDRCRGLRCGSAGTPGDIGGCLFHRHRLSPASGGLPTKRSRSSMLLVRAAIACSDELVGALMQGTELPLSTNRSLAPR